MRKIKVNKEFDLKVFPVKIFDEDVFNLCLPGDCNPICVPTCSPSCSPCYPFEHCNPEIFGGDNEESKTVCKTKYKDLDLIK